MEHAQTRTRINIFLKISSGLVKPSHEKLAKQKHNLGLLKLSGVKQYLYKAKNYRVILSNSRFRGIIFGYHISA